MKIALMGSIHPDGLEIFKKKRVDTIDLINFDFPSLQKNLAEVDGIVIRTSKLTSDILSECKNLKIFELGKLLLIK